jgi:hypothetical protein
LVHAWPQLAKVDKATRSHAIWLYLNSEPVLAWLATLPQNQRDRWLNPQTIRKHYERRHPHRAPAKPAQRRRVNRHHHRDWNRAPLGERSREDLIEMVGEMGQQLVDRDQHIAELETLLEDKDREIARLKNDLEFETATRKQLERGIRPPMAY